MTKSSFTQIPNHIISDPTLSLQEKGLFVYIASKPKGWEFSSKRMAKENKNSKNTIAKIIKELIKRGMIKKIKHNTGKVNYILCSKSQNEGLGIVHQAPNNGNRGVCTESEAQTPKDGNRSTSLCTKTQKSLLPNIGSLSNTKEESNTKEKDKIYKECKNRLNAMYNRRAKTEWDEKEIEQLKKIIKRDEVLSEMTEIENLRDSGYLYCRKDIKTLLNNWPGELDKARDKIPNPDSKQKTSDIEQWEIDQSERTVRELWGQK